jgi:hypothetical protein
MTGKGVVKALKHVIVRNSRALAHVFIVQVERCKKKEQPIQDGCSAKLSIILHVTVKKLLVLCTNQSAIGLILV